MPPEDSARHVTAPRAAVPEAAEVAVIIAAFNSGPLLDQALATLAAQTLPPSAVVVADDSRTTTLPTAPADGQGDFPSPLCGCNATAGQARPGTARSVLRMPPCSPCSMPMTSSCRITLRPWLGRTRGPPGWLALRNSPGSPVSACGYRHGKGGLPDAIPSSRHCCGATS